MYGERNILEATDPLESTCLVVSGSADPDSGERVELLNARGFPGGLFLLA